MTIRMNNTPRVRGRPREFDLETAFKTGERLFHTYGFESVGIAALTDELGITPPSFYKAFESKAVFFENILVRYSKTVLPLERILLPELSVRHALANLLERAAQTYGKNAARGCLVLESIRGSAENEAVLIARRVGKARTQQIHDFVARENSRAAGPVTDYIVSVMSGLSASARQGLSVVRLLKIARAASAGIDVLLDS